MRQDGISEEVYKSTRDTPTVCVQPEGTMKLAGGLETRPASARSENIVPTRADAKNVIVGFDNQGRMSTVRILGEGGRGEPRRRHGINAPWYHVASWQRAAGYVGRP